MVRRGWFRCGGNWGISDDFDCGAGGVAADAIGVTRQTVIAIEGDKYSPSLETAFRIAHVFGVRLEEAFQYEAGKKR